MGASHLLVGVDPMNRAKCGCRWQSEPHDSYAAACISHSAHAVSEGINLLSPVELEDLDRAVIQAHVARFRSGKVS